MNAPYRTILGSLIALAILAIPVAAQPLVKCGAELRLDPVLTRIANGVVSTATFDVIRGTPTNIDLGGLDTVLGSGLIQRQTVENLHRFAFDRDTFGMRLVFRYVVDDHVSGAYWRSIGRDTFEIVTPAIPAKMRPCEVESRALDLEAHTITLDGYIFTEDTLPQRSKISVERFFPATGQQTMMMENNYPAYDAQIREAALLFDLDRFRSAAGPIGDDVFRSMRYLVRFRVIRRLHGSRTYTVQ